MNQTGKQICSPLVSVLIPTLNGAELLAACLASFVKTVDRIPYELIVIDDGSEQEQKARVKSAAIRYGCKLIERPSRGGYAKAVNEGIQHASGQYVLLLNNDVRFHQSGWLDLLLQTADSASNIGIVGCRLLYPDHTIQHAGGTLLPGVIYDHLYRGEREDHPVAAMTYDIASVTGALMLIKREVLDDIGRLSEEYLLSYEDVDYCLRARQAEWRVVYCGKSAAIHNEGSTRGRTRNEKPDAWYQEELQSHTRFWLKWKDHGSVKPLKSMCCWFVLHESFYRLNCDGHDKLTEGLREQGCRVEVEVIADSETVSFSSLMKEKRSCAGSCVIFTHQAAMQHALASTAPAGIPIVLIGEADWFSTEYPQLVHEFINHASAYIKCSK